MSWQPTTGQILNLDGVRRRADGFRFELVDQEGQRLGDLHPDRDRPPVVSNDTNRTVHRQLGSFYLPASEIHHVNVITDRVTAWMVLQNGVEYQLGYFLWKDHSMPQRGWGEEHACTLYDRTLQLHQAFTGSLGWETGARSELIFLFLLFSAGMGLEDIAESGPFQTLSAAVSWPPGTTHLRAMTDIAKQVAIAAPWADRRGLFHFAEPPDPAAPDAEPEIPPYGPGTRVIADSIVRSRDPEAPNYFFVYDTDPESSITGSYALPAAAPHSEDNRGHRIALVEGMQGLASRSQANRAARTLARTSGPAFEEIQWASTADPRHETWDLLQVDGDLVLETGWAITCRSGVPMTHTARRVY